ncbi:MAG: hypothetical protein ACKOYH_03595 [Cyanobium sp.]
MACRRCGCRMVTKVGRSAPMLICTDCGLPVDQRETAELKRKRLWGAVTLISMACMGGVLLLMVSINEMRTAGQLHVTPEGEKESKEKGGEKSGSLGPGELDAFWLGESTSENPTGGAAQKPAGPIQGRPPGSPEAPLR